MLSSVARPFYGSPIPVVIVDADDRVVGMNPAAEALYGAAEQDVQGRSPSVFVELTHGDGTTTNDVARALDEHGIWRGPMVRRTVNGRTIPIDATLLRIPDPADGRHLTYSFLAPGTADGPARPQPGAALADPERLQETLIQAQKMEALGQLIPGITHELNNPLSAIIAFSQLMKRDGRLPPDVHRDADLLMAEADRTRRIVRDLLEFTRSRSAGRQPASVAELIDGTVELQGYALGKGRIDVRTSTAEGLPPVEVDASQIQQVLLNLFLNAIQAIRSSTTSGSITIETTLVHEPGGAPGTDLVRIAVTDDGPGVPEAMRGRLFEPFSSTRKPGKGSGLGLWVSRAIVAAHGGRLWFEPAPRGGSRFVFELPGSWPTGGSTSGAGPVAGRDAAPGGGASGAPGGAASGAPGAAPGAGPPVVVHERRVTGVVLAVDDEPFIRQLLEAVLGRAGHQVAVASSGQEAIELIRTMAFDVLVADHRMSGMDGAQLYEQAVKVRPELIGRAVIMSGDAQDPLLREFVSANQLRLLAKPFDLDALLRIVDEVLRLP